MGKAAIVEFCRDGAHRLFNGEITGEELASEIRRRRGLAAAVRFREMPLFEYGAGLEPRRGLKQTSRRTEDGQGDKTTV